MLKNKILWGIVILFVSILINTSPGMTQDDLNNETNSNVKKLTLTECVNIAREKSPLILQSFSDVEIARAKLAEARSGYMPKFNAKVSFNYFNTNTVIKTPLPDSLITQLSENAVMESLRNRALVSGRNPVSGAAISELDVLSALAAKAGSTPYNTFSALTAQAANKMMMTGQNVLLTPMLGTELFRTEVTFQQPVFLWGKVYNLNKQAKAGIGAARSEVKKIQNDLTYSVAERYQQVLLAKDGLNLAKDIETKFVTLADIVEALYKGEAENVTKLDYLEIKANLGLVRAKRIEVEKSLSLAKAALRQTMGLDDDVEIDTAEDEQSYEPMTVNMQDSIRKALINRPEFSKLEYGLTAKKHEIKVANAENKPKILIDSVLDINKDNRNYLEPDPVDFRLSLIADIPLFDGLKTRATVNQRKQELEKLKQTRRQLEQGVTLEVIDAVLSLEETQGKVNVTKEAAENSTEYQSLSRESFELEIVDSDRVVRAQVLEAKVKTEYLLSIFNYNLAKAKYNKVIGNADDFSSTNLGDYFIRQFENTIMNKEKNNDNLNVKPESIL